MYELQILPSAEKQIKKLEAAAKKEIVRQIETLALDPLPAGDGRIKKLTGFAAYRLKVKDYRVVFEVKPNGQIVIIVLVAHRREVYKKLSR